MEITFNQKHCVNQDSFSILQLLTLKTLQMYMNNLDVCFTVVCITEAWLNNANVNTYELPGNLHQFDYRTNKIRGGMSIFIKHNVENRTRN